MTEKTGPVSEQKPVKNVGNSSRGGSQEVPKIYFMLCYLCYFNSIKTDKAGSHLQKK